MANFSERIVTGRKYRICTDEENNKWDRISFWTAASDVELEDGTSLEESIEDIKNNGDVLFGVLKTGEDVLILSDSNISKNSIVEVYTSEYGVNPKNIVVSDGSISISFATQKKDIKVAVKYKNVGADSGSFFKCGGKTISDNVIWFYHVHKHTGKGVVDETFTLPCDCRVFIHSCVDNEPSSVNVGVANALINDKDFHTVDWVKYPAGTVIRMKTGRYTSDYTDVVAQGTCLVVPEDANVLKLSGERYYEE